MPIHPSTVSQVGLRRLGRRRLDRRGGALREAVLGGAQLVMAWPAELNGVQG